MMEAGSTTNAEVISKDVVNVRVVTRLRPFNSREAHLSSENILQISEKTVTVTDTKKERNLEFQCDSCHWSHDGFVVNEGGVPIPDGPNSQFSDQEAIFKDIGLNMMEAAWQGRKATVVGYGITGSGKSYTLLGQSSDLGLMYRYCRHLFGEMDRNPQNRYKVTVSVLEIYNEKVIDLLSKSIKALKIRLKRQTPQSHQKTYVEDLTVPWMDYHCQRRGF